MFHKKTAANANTSYTVTTFEHHWSTLWLMGTVQQAEDEMNSKQYKVTDTFPLHFKLYNFYIFKMTEKDKGLQQRFGHPA